MSSDAREEDNERLRSDVAGPNDVGGCSALSLDSLPRTLLTSILQQLQQQGSNPGALMHLALVSTALRDAVFSAEGLWEQHCIRQGYASPRSGDTRPHLPDGEEDERWRAYYSKRMMARWRVRRYLKLLLPFMRREAQASFLPGASPEEISRVEQRLGIALPWELWEMYRHRGGQAPGPAVALVDDVRLLRLSELELEEQHLPPAAAWGEGLMPHPEVPAPRPLCPHTAPPRSKHPPGPGASDLLPGPGDSDLLPGPGDSHLLPEVAGSGAAAQADLGCAPLGAGGCSPSTQSPGPQGPGPQGPGPQGPGPQGPGPQGPSGPQSPGAVSMIMFCSNITGSRRYLMSSTGQVFIARGLMVTALAASSVSLLLQRLLS